MTPGADAFKRAFGLAVSKIRVQLGISQRDLAADVGLTQPRISRVESGDGMISAHQYVVIADALGMSVGELQEYVEAALHEEENTATTASIQPPQEPAPWPPRSWAFCGDPAVLTYQGPGGISIDEAIQPLFPVPEDCAIAWNGLFAQAEPGLTAEAWLMRWRSMLTQRLGGNLVDAVEAALQ